MVANQTAFANDDDDNDNVDNDNEWDVVIRADRRELLCVDATTVRKTFAFAPSRFCWPSAMHQHVRLRDNTHDVQSMPIIGMAQAQ